MPQFDDPSADVSGASVVTVSSAMKMDYPAVGCAMSNRRCYQRGPPLVLIANSTQLLAANIAIQAWQCEPQHPPPPFYPRPSAT
jgi:hypothetical protein